MKSLAEMQRDEVTAATLTQDQINTREMLRLEMLTSLEKYTKAMFRAQYKRSFIVAEHHRRIIGALQDVVDGKCKRLMINIAPRYGKCLVPETEILTSQGIKLLRDIVPGDAVYSYRDGTLTLNRVLAVEPAYKPTVTLHMRSGRSITGSYDHPMLTPYGYKELQSFLPVKSGKIMALMQKNGSPIGGFYYEEVFAAAPGPAKELIHIEVENDHNFIANGLVSHNTELVIKSFISWCFALNPMCRFLHLSYSDVLVEDNSATIRSIMSEELYKTLFPSSALASEKGSSKRWRTKAGGELYAVSTQGQVTGFGAGAVDLDPELDKLDGGNDVFVFDDHTNEVLSMIGARSNVFQGAVVIDDPIKPEDAESDLVRERINNRFETTIRNRTNSRNTPIIIIMQRLHEHDLCGYLQEIEPDEWTVLSLPALMTDPDTGEERALWPMKHTVEELHRMREINPVVFDTQYMQDPTPKEGLMYSAGFRTYAPADLPALARGGSRRNYTDTADTGADFHCSICFIDTPEFIYVTDVLFTDAPMEVTEPRQAEMLTRNSVVDCLIESNNGGRGFARNVKRILRSDLHNFKTVVHTFTQTQNKRSRIFTNSAQVQNDVLFPEDWQRRWPKFYSAITSYRKDNRKRSQHDDAPDCLTGVYEMHSGRGRRKGIRRMN